MLIRTTPRTLTQALHLDALASEASDPLALHRAYNNRRLPIGRAGHRRSFGGRRRSAFAFSDVDGLLYEGDGRQATHSGGTASALPDQSGNGHDFTAPSAAEEPAYTEASHKLTFDATDDVLAASAHSDFTITAAGFTWFVVFSCTAATTRQVADLTTGGGTNEEWRLFAHHATPGAPRLVVWDNTDSGNIVDGSASANDGAKHILEARVDVSGGTIGIRVDGGTEATADIGTPQSNQGHTPAIGETGSRPYGGDLYYAVLYKQHLSASERTKVRAKLASLEGITL